MMKKFLVLIVLIAIIFSIVQIANYKEYVLKLERFNEASLVRWLTEQKINIDRIDIAIGKFIISDNPRYLTEAINYIDKANSLFISSPTSSDIRAVLVNSNYRNSLLQMKDYITYHSENQVQTEIKIYKSMRDALEIKSRSYFEIINKIETIKRNHSRNFLAKSTWQKIQNIGFDDFFKPYAQELRLIQNPANLDYNYYLFLQNSQNEDRARFLENSLVNAEFDRVNEATAEELAANFYNEISSIISLESITNVSSSNVSNASATSGRDESLNIFGEVFYITNKVDDIEYTASISEIGGFVLDFWIYSSDKLISVESYKDIMEILARFNNIEKYTLMDYDSFPSNHVIYYPIRDEVGFSSNYISMSLDQANKVFSIDSRRYFYNIGQEFSGYLDDSEILNYLGSYVKIVNEPKLVFQSRLLYHIVISNIDRIDELYLDAYTGEVFHLIYDFER